MPTRARRNASFEDANSILFLILASSGDLIAPDQQLSRRLNDSPGKLEHIARAFHSPREENDLVPLSGTLLLESKVVHCPTAFSFWEIGQKVVVGLRVRLLRYDDLSLVTVEIEDNIFGLLAQLQTLKC